MGSNGLYSTETIWFPESLYNTWLSDSLVLMTASLLFYHMTRVSSLEMDPRIAGVFAVCLISISIALGITSVIPYITRVTALIKQDQSTEVSQESKKEGSYRTVYTILGCLLILIQIGIAITIIKVPRTMANTPPHISGAKVKSTLK